MSDACWSLIFMFSPPFPPRTVFSPWWRHRNTAQCFRMRRGNRGKRWHITGCCMLPCQPTCWLIAEVPWVPWDGLSLTNRFLHQHRQVAISSCFHYYHALSFFPGVQEQTSTGPGSHMDNLSWWWFLPRSTVTEGPCLEKEIGAQPVPNHCLTVSTL